MNAVIMPALGQTSDELKILAWLKKEGEAVAVGEALISLETDKTTIEVESAFAGVLTKILHGVEATVQAGQVIAYIGLPGEAIPQDKPVPPQEQQAIEPANRVPVPSAPLSTGKVLATPAARQLAREHGVDLSLISGSGPDGRIERDDVQKAIG